MLSKFYLNLLQNAGKDPQWYAAQEGDARMLHIASLPGPKIFFLFTREIFFKNM